MFHRRDRGGGDRSERADTDAASDVPTGSELTDVARPIEPSVAPRATLVDQGFAGAARGSLAGSRIVLLTDDDAMDEVATALRTSGHRVAVASGTVALGLTHVGELDLAVLDGVVSPEQRLDVFRRFHDELDIPVVVLDHGASTTERLLWQALGACDVLDSASSDHQLAEELQRVLQQPLRASSESISVGGLRLDMGSRMIEVETRIAHLTRQEALLLQFMMRRPDVTFSRSDLLEQVWGHTIGGTSTVPVHIRRLREKIEVDPARPRYVITMWGAGYCLRSGVGT